jgi:hypothetical protein
MQGARLGGGDARGARNAGPEVERKSLRLATGRLRGCAGVASIRRGQRCRPRCPGRLFSDPPSGHGRGGEPPCMPDHNRRADSLTYAVPDRGGTKRAALARCSTRAAARCPLPDPWRRVRDPSWIRSPRRRSVSSLRRAVSVPCCARFADDPLDPFPQLDGCGCIEPADGFDGDQLLRERPRELGRGRHPPQQHFAALRWKRSVGKGGQVTGGSAPHRSTTGRIASSVGARGWGLSLMRAMSRTGTGVAMPQLPLMSLNGGRVSVLPERVMICSL